MVEADGNVFCRHFVIIKVLDTSKSGTDDGAKTRRLAKIFHTSWGERDCSKFHDNLTNKTRRWSPQSQGFFIKEIWMSFHGNPPNSWHISVWTKVRKQPTNQQCQPYNLPFYVSCTMNFGDWFWPAEIIWQYLKTFTNALVGSTEKLMRWWNEQVCFTLSSLISSITPWKKIVYSQVLTANCE